MLHVQTEDARNESQPFQPFPDKPYLFYLIHLLQSCNRLLIPKSRQMTVTWTCAAFFLHRAMFFPSRLIFFSSKKEEDAEALIQRTKTMYDRLPKWLRDICPIEQKHCRLYFPSQRSEIKGIPAGPDQIRGYTPTDLFSDEAVYQDELKDMIAAALPAIGQKGRIVMVSSAGPSHFQELVFDTV